jgi:hypothetical protein
LLHGLLLCRRLLLTLGLTLLLLLTLSFLLLALGLYGRAGALLVLNSGLTARCGFLLLSGAILCRFLLLLLLSVGLLRDCRAADARQRRGADNQGCGQSLIISTFHLPLP